jgi:glycosyltransferase involved in cell wall biosynthesis
MAAAASRDDVVGIGRAATGREIVMLVVSDLRVDPRVEREARALAAAGYSVKIFCPDPTQGKNRYLKIDWGNNINIEFLHWSAASFVRYRPGLRAGKLFDSALRHRPFAFHAHDLNTTVAARAAARVTGAHFVADFHEWFSENVRWDVATASYQPHAAAWKADLQEQERICLREASAVVTVCDSIADAMAQELGEGRRPAVVRNIPSFSASPTRSYPPLKQQFGLPEDCFALLYQGGVGPTRYLEPVIEALGEAKRCTLILRGPSIEHFEKAYRKLAEKVGAQDRLILAGPVPSKDVVAAARGADAGIWTLPALCRNFVYALPNKIFEYMAAGLPVLAAHYPEVRRIVEGHQVGLVFDPDSPGSIAAAINRLVDDRKLRADFAGNIEGALGTIDADREWQRLVEVYDALPRSAQDHVASVSPAPTSRG